MRNFVLTLLAVSLAWGGGSGKGKALFSDNFSGTALSAKWKAPKGDWTVKDGVLRGVERAADKHAAVVRHPVAYHDAVIAVEFRFDGGKQFSLSLNRQGGHACRVIVRPDGLTVQRDKMNAKATEPAKVLAKQALPISSGQWHRLVLTVHGPRMEARVDNGPVVAGDDPGVDVDKVDVGLPVSGDSVSFRKLQIKALAGHGTD
jgi:hypothetical protein